jgi:Ca-activated chloride channel family protein
MRPGDSAMIAGFGSEIQPLCPFSTDHRELNDAIDCAGSGGALTRMRDAIHQLIQHRLRSVSGRKAIVLLTDGQDHGSRISEADLLNEAAASDTMIYSIYYTVDPQKILKQMGLDSRIPAETARKEDGPYASWYESERKAARYLEELSVLSAGRFYRSGTSKLDDAFKQITRELRSQYLIGFYPDNSKLNGSVHTLEVKVTVPDAVVRSRRSYRAAPRMKEWPNSLRDP